MVLLLLPGFQPIALIIAVAAFLFTLIPGIQPIATTILALAF